MVPEKIILLAVDDEPQDLELVVAALDDPEGMEVITTTDPLEALELVRTRHPRIVLTDLAMPRLNGMQLLEQILEFDPGTDVVMMTAHYSTESAVEAIRKGACDYINKPLSVRVLRERVAKLIEIAKDRRRAFELEQACLSNYQYRNLVGKSPLMLDIFARIRRVAPHFQTALVSGPTGTGKELVARALHAESNRAGGPFVVCNCAGLAEIEADSELFGYVEGALPGATQSREGLLERAAGGTLFLDEIGEIALGTQAKIVRALQDHEIRPLGAAEARPVQVAFVAATSYDLPAMVEAKEFREDLYYCLAAVRIVTPRLGQRREDVPLLVRHLLERFAHRQNKAIRGVTRRAQMMLAAYAWPGNVRELENAIGYACAMTDREVLDIRDFPEDLRIPERAGDADEIAISVEELTRRHARRVLAAFDGNKSQAAETLGISRSRLYRLLEEPL